MSKQIERKFSEITQSKRTIRIKDVIGFFLCGTCCITLYYVYQRYKNQPEIKEELKVQQIEIKGFRDEFYQINGYFFPRMMTSALKEIKEFETRSSDVWVCSFPKSGTTWLQEIVYLIVTDCDFIKAKSKILVDRSPFIEFPTPGIKAINEMESPRVIKTHLPIESLPNHLESKSKIVYIVRNPKDVCVSLFYFVKMVKNADFEGTISDMINLFIEGKIPYGPWPKHVDSYASKSHIHIVHYEDLLSNPKEELKRLCNYLGKKLDDKKLDAIVEWCSFENMKKNPSVNYEWEKTLGFFSKEGEFFRKGKAGDWLNYFTNIQSKQLDDFVKSQLKYRKKFDYGISGHDSNKI